MLQVGTVQSEVVIEGENSNGQDESQRPDESRREELRRIVRELIQEELERFLRTEARG